MAETERVRIELAFEGGQIIAAAVTPAAADELEAAVGQGTGTVAVDAEDGRVTVVASRVAYVKRYRRESSIGF
jgi:molybdopterin-binding protein